MLNNIILLSYVSCNFWLKENMNKFYCTSELNQHLVDVWQSTEERY